MDDYDGPAEGVEEMANEGIKRVQLCWQRMTVSGCRLVGCWLGKAEVQVKVRLNSETMEKVG